MPVVQIHDSITLGRRRRTIELAGLRVVEAVYPPGQVFAAHAHGSANVTLVCAGGFGERSPHACVRARPTSLVIKPRGTVHANRYGDRETRTVLIEVAPGREADVGLLGVTRERWLQGGRFVAEVLEILRAARAGEADLERTAIERVSALVRRAALAPEARAPEARAPRGVRAAQALREAEAHLRASLARPVGSAEVARRVGLHPVYLARVFHAAHGCGVAAYRRRLQVEEAARRLAETAEPAGQVALAAGFADQSHLCRAFKAELGLSPCGWRELVRAE